MNTPNRPLLKKVLITCGPASEAIDAVRRITNHSSGELGDLLATSFLGARYEVLCLRGSMATHRNLPMGAGVREFFGNQELLTALQQIDPSEVGVVLHAAALSDFSVASISTASEQENATGVGKISSRLEEVQITLRPAPKVLIHLRQLFPSAILVGWKYEVDGNESTLANKANDQIRTAGLDACVGNGPAIGPRQILFFASSRECQRFASKSDLASALPGILEEMALKRTL